MLGFFIIFLSLLPLFISPLWIRIATEVLMWAGLAQSWNIIGGYTGYLCFGHGAFFGVGAYFTGILMIYLNMPFGLCLFISGIMASFLAFLIGYPTLRLRGAYFAIATWAFGEMVRQIAIILNITGGAFGMQLPPYLNLPFFYYIMLLVAGITYLSTYTLLERAKFGYKLLAIREHEEAAEMVGVDTTMIKIKAFVLSAFFPGVMGGIYAYWVTYIHPDSVLKADITDFMVVMAFLGGIGSLWGPFLGAVVVQLIQRILWIFWGEGTFYLVIIGLSICAVVLFIPNGLIGLLEGKVSSPKESITFLLKKLKW
ncbi:MAG: branched-chain amino acid ABC transporter permease [Thermodesulfobacteriota bacterium]